MSAANLGEMGLTAESDEVKALDQRMGDLMTSLRERAPGARLYLGSSWSMPLGDPQFFQSEREQAAGAKLKEAGFSSPSFDDTVRETAAADVRAFAGEQGWPLP